MTLLWQAQRCSQHGSALLSPCSLCIPQLLAGKVLGLSQLQALIPVQAGQEPLGQGLRWVLALASCGCRALLLLPRSLPAGRWPESVWPARSPGLYGHQAWGKGLVLQLAGQEETRASRGLGWAQGRRGHSCPEHHS